jgi:hypothetical protein
VALRRMPSDGAEPQPVDFQAEVSDGAQFPALTLSIGCNRRSAHSNASEWWRYALSANKGVR